MKTNADGLNLIALFIDDYDVESRTAAERAVNLFVKAKITPNQFSALVCLVMREGIEVFRTSKMLRLINASSKDRDLLLKAANEFGKYIYVKDENGVRIADQFLIYQVDFERDLFLKPALVPQRRRS